MMIATQSLFDLIRTGAAECADGKIVAQFASPIMV
jgi:hypothetical protein